MRKVIEVRNLYKLYRVGDEFVRALDGVDFEIYEGEFCAIVGTSGSGKSTFMNILVDAIDRSSGEILYNGKETISMGKDYRNLIGYMPQQQGVYDSFTVAEFLDYIKRIKKNRGKKTNRRSS